MRSVLSFFFCCLFFGAAAFAQAPGVITDGGAAVNFQAGGITTTNTGGFAAQVRFPAVPTPVNHTFQVGWWLRSPGDSTQLRQPLPTATNYVGNTATFTFPPLGAQGITASLVVTVQDSSAGAGTSGQTIWTLTLNNPTASPQTVQVFAYADIDAAGTAGGDSASLVQANNWIRVVDGATEVDLRGVGADAFRVTGFATLRTALNGATPITLDNSGLPFGPGDFTGAVQWIDRTIPANGNSSFTWVISVNEAAVPVELEYFSVD